MVDLGQKGWKQFHLFLITEIVLLYVLAYYFFQRLKMSCFINPNCSIPSINFKSKIYTLKRFKTYKQLFLLLFTLISNLFLKKVLIIILLLLLLGYHLFSRFKFMVDLGQKGWKQFRPFYFLCKSVFFKTGIYNSICLAI